MNPAPINQSPRLCVITAADIEFTAVTKLLTGSSVADEHRIKSCSGQVANTHVTVLQSEIGAVGFASRLAAHLSARRYAAALMIGLCGALQTESKTGDVLLYDACLAAPATKKGSLCKFDVPISCDARLTGLIKAAFDSAGQAARTGTGLTLDRMITAAAEKRLLGARSGAAALDMESYGIVQTAQTINLPVGVLRVVLDEADQQTPDFNAAVGSDGRMSNWRAGLAMLRSPVAAWHFLRSLRPAMAALEQSARLALSVNFSGLNEFEPGTSSVTGSDRLVDNSQPAR